MAIVTDIEYLPFDESDPDDFRPNSKWALLVDPNAAYLERNPAPGTENDPPKPAFTIDVRALVDGGHDDVGS